jgi:hypothetical protein
MLLISFPAPTDIQKGSSQVQAHGLPLGSLNDELLLQFVPESFKREEDIQGTMTFA